MVGTIHVYFYNNIQYTHNPLLLKTCTTNKLHEIELTTLLCEHEVILCDSIMLLTSMLPESTPLGSRPGPLAVIVRAPVKGSREKILVTCGGSTVCVHAYNIIVKSFTSYSFTHRTNTMPCCWLYQCSHVPRPYNILIVNCIGNKDRAYAILIQVYGTCMAMHMRLETISLDGTV